MLEQIFLKVIDMSLAASMVIMAVFPVRLLLKRFPKHLSYMLWTVVLFRLLCPVSFELSIGLVPEAEPAFYEHTPEEDTVLPEGKPGGAVVPHTGSETEYIPGTGQLTPPQFSPEETVRAAEASRQELLILAGKYVWILGMGILLLYCVISAVRIRRKVSVSVPFKENIYIAEGSVSPFVMGLCRPRIYLPDGLGEKEREYIILHEKFHIRRLDHVVKPVAFAALCIHWFNPLVWIAFILFCKDMEMSCDEAVVNRLGEEIRADYSASLLALSIQHRVIPGIPVDFGKGNTKDRVKNLAAFRKTKKSVQAVLTAGVLILITCLAFDRKGFSSEANDPMEKGNIESNSKTSDTDDEPAQINDAESPETPDTDDEPAPLIVSLDISKHYFTNTGDTFNLYYIDENNVLWGSGHNQCGQLGQGTHDYEYHSDLVKIAEDVIHVDYSHKLFTIFLTKDHKLYGMGNAGCGALQQYDTFDWGRYVSTHPEDYCICEPCLLMEDVIYARCGRADIVCMKEDGTVWTWGTIYAEGNILSNYAFFIEKPKKILENAVLVTGGWNNHAALLQDGTVWTWGYNSAGNCGVAEPAVIGEPIMVAEDVVMVRTDDREYNINCYDIEELDKICPPALNNTVIQKTDGSRWICGENVGTEEKVVRGAESDYTVLCTHEFLPYE